MEIKVNEFVRTKDGLIAQIINIIEENYQERGNILYELDKEVFDETEGYEEYSFYALPDQFIKHSPNIIDLIEEGDFVNGYICKRIPNFDNKMCNFDLNLMQWIPLEDIDVWYNIVTKEQFDSRKYIVGDESNE